MTTPAAATTTTWKLDATHTSVEFSAKHLMITTVKGRFADMAGTITVNGDSPAAASVDVTIQAASIDSRTEGRDQHLRSADFLDVEKFPTITFKSTKLEGARDEFKMTGDLTIHGVTKSITLDVTNEGEVKDPWGGRRMGFTATGKIDRREFGLVWNGALEAGGVLVGTDIKIQIDAQIVQAV
jgi:polyisoprenoid-binding protein YceI